jgi:hypothetical protein
VVYIASEGGLEIVFWHSRWSSRFACETQADPFGA